MPYRLLERVTEQMTVVDRSGRTIGSVLRVEQPPGAPVIRHIVAPETPDVVESSRTDSTPDLFIPRVYLLQVRPGTVVINAENDQIDDLGRQRRPPSIGAQAELSGPVGSPRASR